MACTACMLAATHQHACNSDCKVVHSVCELWRHVLYKLRHPKQAVVLSVAAHSCSPASTTAVCDTMWRARRGAQQTRCVEPCQAGLPVGQQHCQIELTRSIWYAAWVYYVVYNMLAVVGLDNSLGPCFLVSLHSCPWQPQMCSHG